MKNKINKILERNYEIDTKIGYEYNKADNSYYTNFKFSSEYKITFFPLITGYSDKSLESALFCASKSPGRILIKTIPKCLEGGYKEESKKSESREMSILSSSTDNLKTSPFLIVLEHNLTSYPDLFKKENNPLCTFSSNKNLILRWNLIQTSLCESSSKFQTSLNMLFIQRRIRLHYILDCSPSFQHLKNQINHNPSSFEGRFSMTNLRVNYDVFINFDSHEMEKDDSLFKDFVKDLVSFLELNKIPNRWQKTNKKLNRSSYTIKAQFIKNEK